MDLTFINTFIDEGMLAIIFTTVAAIVSSMLEKRKKIKNAHEPTSFIEKTFTQIESMVDDLREQNGELRDKNEQLRENYYNQIEVNNQLGSQLTKLHLKIESNSEDVDKEEQDC